MIKQYFTRTLPTMLIALVVPGCALRPDDFTSRPYNQSDYVYPQPPPFASVQTDLPELTEASVINDYLSYAALNNPQLSAALARWKAARQRIPQANRL